MLGLQVSFNGRNAGKHLPTDAARVFYFEVDHLNVLTQVGTAWEGPGMGAGGVVAEEPGQRGRRLILLVLDSSMSEVNWMSFEEDYWWCIWFLISNKHHLYFLLAICLNWRLKTDIWLPSLPIFDRVNIMLLILDIRFYLHWQHKPFQ